MGTSIAFYLSFALLAASMSTQEQKAALRYALSLGVVFCLNEISVLQEANRVDAAAFNSPVHLMPRHLCLFEKVSVNSPHGGVAEHQPSRLSVALQLDLHLGQALCGGRAAH